MFPVSVPFQWTVIEEKSWNMPVKLNSLAKEPVVDVVVEVQDVVELPEDVVEAVVTFEVVELEEEV